VSTLDDRLLEQSASRRFQVLILAAFAGLAVVLAGAGIFAAMHYSVARRTQEIGIRLALGARPRSVVAMVLGEALRLTAIGVALGLLGAAAVTQLLAHLLFGVTAHDSWTFAAVAFGLAAVAVAAAVVPAARAARVDPLAAVRTE
jgi:putative ABC transport system permease protein